MKLLELDSASDLDFHFHLDLAGDCGVGVGPAQQFVDVRTDKLTGSRATRWQVPVTLAWQEAATATSALTRCPTWRCAALQQLVLAAQLDLAWLSSAWHDKASKSVDYFILQRFVAAIAALPLLLSLPQPQFLPLPLRSAPAPLWLLLCRLHLLPAAVAVVLRVMNKFAQFVK